MANSQHQQGLQTSKDATHMANSQTEYAVKRYSRQKSYGQPQKYIVQWYGYEHEYSTLEPSKNVLLHFRKRYYKRENYIPASTQGTTDW